ncbi:MAG: hypothetical protein EOM20_02030 [Spartobacteria bacterium]|nr:hypothetical protein [Spartobacteria bacterium]
MTEDLQSARRTRLRQKILLCIASILLVLFMAILLGELYCRNRYGMLNDILNGQANKGDYFMYDSELGWKGRPNVSGLHVSGSHITHNDRGYRDTPWDIDTTKKRVLLLGDSNMWGYGVEDDEHPAALLNEKPPHIRWFNAGMNGYGTDQQYLTFLRIAPELKPDWTVLVVCGNDRKENQHRRIRGYDKPYFSINEGALVLSNVPVPKPEIDHDLPLATRAFKKVHSYLLYHIAQAIDSRANTEANQLVRDTEDPTELIVKALYDAAEGRLLVCPMVADRQLLGFCREAGIPVADMSATDAAQPGPLQYPGGAPKHGHWTPEGNRVAAEFIFSSLRPYLFSEDADTDKPAGTDHTDRKTPPL